MTSTTKHTPRRTSAKEQLRLGLQFGTIASGINDVRTSLEVTLSGDLDFHGANDFHPAHKIHSFPAKFPPQLPRTFIEALTKPGDVVLDPMMGSGTTLLEAYLLYRRAIGFDIDPLALRIAQVKTTPLDKHVVLEQARHVIKRAKAKLQKNSGVEICSNGHDKDTQDFIDYWFLNSTRCELIALTQAICEIDDLAIREFLELALSATIITKSGGVSMALDLAHTRPHRAKVVVDANGQMLVGEDKSAVKHRALVKTLRSALDEFQKRVIANLRGLVELGTERINPQINSGDSQFMPIRGASVDLIVTSPPYASNAIDYMRAHKFSLVWLGYSINSLGDLRNHYIGGETTSHFKFTALPSGVERVVRKVSDLDPKKGLALHRYYSEMTRSIGEMFRVLRPNRCAVLVVGNSILRNTDTEIPESLASIGRAIGFDVVKIGVRDLDRNRRMLPAHHKPNLASQIQQRMHQEYVIGLYKNGDEQ